MHPTIYGELFGSLAHVVWRLNSEGGGWSCTALLLSLRLALDRPFPAELSIPTRRMFPGCLPLNVPCPHTPLLCPQLASAALLLPILSPLSPTPCSTTWILLPTTPTSNSRSQPWSNCVASLGFHTETQGILLTLCPFPA